MGFLNLKKALEKYSEEPMKGNAERLSDFDDFHCLRAGGMSAALKLQEKAPAVPAQYLDWVRICDGGLLFDTVLASVKGRDDQLDLEFDTYEDLNSKDALAGFGLPAGYFVFAMRSYGDPICFSTAGKDGKVYLWDREQGDFSDIWDSFADWITEEIDDAVRLIGDGVLDPLPIKQGRNADE